MSNPQIEPLADVEAREDEIAVTLPTMNLDELEQIAIPQAMAFCEGNILCAAKALGINASTLYRKLNNHKIFEDSQKAARILCLNRLLVR